MARKKLPSLPKLGQKIKSGMTKHSALAAPGKAVDKPEKPEKTKKGRKSKTKRTY